MLQYQYEKNSNFIQHRLPYLSNHCGSKRDIRHIQRRLQNTKNRRTKPHGTRRTKAAYRI